MCVIEHSPRIETRRLVLRSPEVRDAGRIAELCDERDIARMTLRMPHPYTRNDAAAFLAGVMAHDPARSATFLIEEEDAGPVGMLGFFYDSDPFPEVGYWIGKPYWGRGFATEACGAAVDWARRRWNKRAVMAGHFPDNPASGRVLSSNGFLYTGEVRRRRSLARGEDTDIRMMVWLA